MHCGTHLVKKNQLSTSPKKKCFHLTDSRLHCVIVPNRHSCAVSRRQTHPMVENKEERTRRRRKGKKANLKASNLNLNKQQQQHLHVTGNSRRKAVVHHYFITTSDIPLFPPSLPYFQKERENNGNVLGSDGSMGGKFGVLQPKKKADKKVDWSQCHTISKAIFHRYGNLRESFWLLLQFKRFSCRSFECCAANVDTEKNNDFTFFASKSAFQKQAIKNIHVFLWCAIMLLIPHQQYAQQTQASWRIRSISECWWFSCH